VLRANARLRRKRCAEDGAPGLVAVWGVTGGRGGRLHNRHTEVQAVGLGVAGRG
jgi:hypothetical protein